MGDPAPNLRDGMRQVSGLEPPPAAPEPPQTYSSVTRLFDDERAELLKHIPPWTVKKAWFALSHLLLEPGARVVDMGCRDGSMVYTMAVLAPNMTFVGVDKNPDTITAAKETYRQENLEFYCADILDNALPDESADAIICNFVLHEIFSSSDFNQRLVRQTLRDCGRYLKPGGHLFVRDFAEPVGAEELVLIEMPDMPSKSTKLEELSEPDLLIWYSEYATMQDDPGASGFFLEELPPRFPRTRLFRLPHKWAYEFIMRKDARTKWQAEVPKEYTFFNEREYHRTLNTLGLRVLYSAPHWDDTYIKKHFEKNFRLMDENGAPLGTPATSFSVLAQKVDHRDAVLLAERRKAKTQGSSFHVTTYRNDVDGRLVEIVSRDLNSVDIIPFSIMEGNRLVVYLHEGVPRGLVNAVPRGGRNLDGKFWSGHLTEAVSVDAEVIKQVEENGEQGVVNFMHDALGLKPSVGQSFVAGPSYYPNPRFIAERVETRFISVEPHVGRFVPGFVREDIKGFASTGAIKAFDAQSVLNAISVGALPSGNLETQLLVLFAMLEIHPVDWAESPLILKEDESIKNAVKVSDVLKKTAKKEKKYSETRGTLGKIKLEKSIFVDEGVDTDGVNKGLAARDVDFVVNEESGMNVAVILPLSRQHSGEVMAGVIVDYMPIPERYGGDGEMVSLPTLNLPKDAHTVEQARKYIAEKFEIKIDQVSKMGEPYFSHVGVTPQRIFPFAINCPHSKMAQPKHGLTAVTPLKDIAKLHWKDLFERYDCDLLKVFGRAHKRNFSQIDMGLNWTFDMPMVPRYSDLPFTTGTAVDVRMTSQNTQKQTTLPPAPAQKSRPLTGTTKPAVQKSTQPPAPMRIKPTSSTPANLPNAPQIPAGEMAGMYAGATGGLTRAAKQTERGERAGGKGGGKGGNASGGSGKRGFKPTASEDKKKKSTPTLSGPKPEQ